jgi:hypothetical protein
MNESTWQEFWNKLPIVQFRMLEDRTVLIKPPTKGHNHHEVKLICRKKVRDYRLMHFRIWETDHFISHMFLWNTASNEIRSLEGINKFSFVVQRMMFYCAQGSI